jgi:hypothetical protein
MHKEDMFSIFGSSEIANVYIKCRIQAEIKKFVKKIRTQLSKCNMNANIYSDQAVSLIIL